MDQQRAGARIRREPIFNVPTAVVATLAVLLVVHVVREWVLTSQQDDQLLVWFAFIPSRYDALITSKVDLPSGLAVDVWTFFTYALIHGSWAHIGFNSLWLVIFGTPVARRLGTARFVLFFVLTAAGGAVGDAG